MAGRLPKQGLDFFPLSVYIFDGETMQFIRSRFTPFEERAELVVIKLLCSLYKTKGYYLQWNEDSARLFADKAGKNVTLELSMEVVDELMKREFFDKAMYTRFGILTSYNIQTIYDKICRDAKRKPPYILSDHRITPWMMVQGGNPNSSVVNSISSGNTTELNQFPPEELPKIREGIPQTKGKESKEKETTTTVEEMVVGPLKIFRENILADQWLIETVCMKAGIGQNEFPGAMDFFFRTKIATHECDEWQSEKDCRRNLLYWAPNYRVLRQQDAVRTVNGKVSPAGFPNGWDPVFFKKLQDGQQISAYYMHLKALGLVPKKDRFGQITDYVPKEESSSTFSNQ